MRTRTTSYRWPKPLLYSLAILWVGLVNAQSPLVIGNKIITNQAVNFCNEGAIQVAGDPAKPVQISGQSNVTFKAARG